MAYTRGLVKKANIDLGEVDFAIDTALSWDGHFPPPGKGDYLVTMTVNEGEYESEAKVLVSRRYVPAVDAREAASIAKDAIAERKSITKKNVKVDRVQAVVK